MQEYITKNIKFVAYLRFKGIFSTKVIKLSRGKAEYCFSMNELEWLKHKQDFDRSDFLTYAQCLDAVVDLAY
jgi:hypothetical protein